MACGIDVVRQNSIRVYNEVSINAKEAKEANVATIETICALQREVASAIQKLILFKNEAIGTVSSEGAKNTGISSTREAWCSLGQSACTRSRMPSSA
jgi:hypothetical protein